MRARLGLAVALAACGFKPSLMVVGDARTDASDAAIDTAPLPDRIRTDLIGYWGFDDPSGSLYAVDTSNSASPVPLEVITCCAITAPMFANGYLVVPTPARLISAPNNHIPADCEDANAVTLEAWVKPLVANQGTISEPTFVAGIAGSVSLRDAVLLQAGGIWATQVRTSAALDGTPTLFSTTAAKTSDFVQIVVVADGSQRKFYINGSVEATGTPGGPQAWDPSFALSLVDEPQHARSWLGSVALVAIYDRGLTPAEIEQNYLAGPNSH